MPAERREQVTRVGTVRVNGQPEELDGSDGRRQPSMGGTSRVSREAQALICERLGVKFPGPTRRGETELSSHTWPSPRLSSTLRTQARMNAGPLLSPLRSVTNDSQ